MVVRSIDRACAAIAAEVVEHLLEHSHRRLRAQDGKASDERAALVCDFSWAYTTHVVEMALACGRSNACSEAR